MSQVTERHEQVRAVLNRIFDPCSVAARVPVGIVDVGIVDGVGIGGGAVRVELLLTSPHCLYMGHFEQVITERLSGLPWVTDVRVVHADSAEIWDEGRMAPEARERLAGGTGAASRYLAGRAGAP